MNVAVKECPTLGTEDEVENLERLKLMLEADNYVAFGTNQTHGKAAYIRVEDGKVGAKEMSFIRYVLADASYYGTYQGYWFCHLEMDEDGEPGYVTSHVRLEV